MIPSTMFTHEHDEIENLEVIQQGLMTFPEDGPLEDESEISGGEKGEDKLV